MSFGAITMWVAQVYYTRTDIISESAWPREEFEKHGGDHQIPIRHEFQVIPSALIYLLKDQVIL